MSNFTSHQAMPEEAQKGPTHGYNPVRVITGTQSVVAVDGEMTQTFKGQDRGSMAELNPWHGKDSILATAQHPKGLPVYAIQDDTLITVNGVQASAAFWAKEGVLTKNPEGDYVEATGETPRQAEAQTEAEVETISDEGMARINRALDPLPQEALDGFAAVAVGAAVGRLDPSAMVTKFAQASGVDPADAQARLEAVAQVYRGQTERALAKQGIAEQDADAFFDYCRTHKPEAMHEAISRQLHAHDVSKWAPLARQWLAQAAPSVEALAAAGIPTRKSSHKAGAVEAYVRGSWMDVRAAARAGLV